MTMQPWQDPDEKKTSCMTLSDGSTRCTETTIHRSGKTGYDSLD